MITSQQLVRECPKRVFELTTTGSFSNTGSHSSTRKIDTQISHPERTEWCKCEPSFMSLKVVFNGLIEHVDCIYRFQILILVFDNPRIVDC